MEWGILKGLAILGGMFLGVILLTFFIAYGLHKKYGRQSFAIKVLPGMITSVIIAMVLIPYGQAYPDPLGAGLTYMLAVLLMVTSLIIGIAFGKFLRK